jgi:hypothetical protein
MARIASSKNFEKKNAKYINFRALVIIYSYLYINVFIFFQYSINRLNYIKNGVLKFIDLN